jgi:hypothetical protein
MSTNQPWAPTQGAPASAGNDDPNKVNGAAQHAGPVPSDAPHEIIDENDPRLVSESLDANVEGDAYAQPAPPPDRTWRAKLKLEGVKQEGTSDVKPYTTGQTKKPPVIPYFTTNISCSIIDPSGKYDGITVYPQFGGGANTNRRKDGTTQVTTILNRIKKPDGTPWAAAGQKMSQLEWIKLFVQALAGEPEIGVETQWEASCQKCAEIAKAQQYKNGYPTRTTGMHHFPPEQDAAKRKVGLTNSPELKCAVDASHGYSKARAVVVRFLHLHELKQA